MVTGFIFFTVGLVGLATIQPDSSTNSIVFSAIAGIGFGAPLILVITGVQLSTPHGLIATATAVVTSTRAVAASLSTAIYAAAFGTRAKTKIPSYIAAAAAQAGLPPSSIPAFIGAVAGNTPDTLSKIPGITPAIIAAGVSALKAAFADSIRVVYIIGAPFGIVACLLCYFLGGLRETMNYHVDAPVEDLKAKHRAGDV
jgi:Fungal trichothecene efflux pump (TRI12)